MLGYGTFLLSAWLCFLNSLCVFLMEESFVWCYLTMLCIESGTHRNKQFLRWGKDEGHHYPFSQREAGDLGEGVRLWPKMFHSAAWRPVATLLFSLDLTLLLHPRKGLRIDVLETASNRSQILEFSTHTLSHILAKWVPLSTSVPSMGTIHPLCPVWAVNHCTYGRLSS